MRRHGERPAAHVTRQYAQQQRERDDVLPVVIQDLTQQLGATVP
jgi:hypothetical protein